MQQQLDLYLIVKANSLPLLDIDVIHVGTDCYSILYHTTTTCSPETLRVAAFPHLVTMVPVSPKTPHARHPSEAAVLNASNLELLAVPREETRVQEFVASQTRYARAQANEGRAVRASWDIGTPEKDKMRLHQLSAGFETPVLRPRAVQSNRTEPNHRSASQPHSNPTPSEPTPQSQKPVKKIKSTSAIRAVSPKRQKTRANKPGTSNPIRKERRARSDTDEEHLASMSSLSSPFSTVHRNLRVSQDLQSDGSANA